MCGVAPSRPPPPLRRRVLSARRLTPSFCFFIPSAALIILWLSAALAPPPAAIFNAVFFSRSSTPSPSKTAGGRAGRERFAGEAYTVLGNQEVCGGCHYWELRPSSDWKSFSVGVAYRGSLGRYEQLGKSSASWCLFASQWLQTALAAKHNNRARSLDWPLPQRIGIYCDYDNGDLLFVDVQRLGLLHAFKAKFQQPVVPAFTLWCGSITVTSGLQVPSFMPNLLTTNRSLSSLSHDQPSVASDVRE
ncbi:hypothetical protein OJAV_G00124780 [Oryzias javanicus]|uniref:B30.2/SPRY domain-containing protein n=1 Tax=Oryzias javanicus TaxID=123683 RepID=A0A437CVP2_ORYJA|nr:hypothetical protein OJAV_G00124780 [Oryzias javanicus]